MKIIAAISALFLVLCSLPASANPYQVEISSYFNYIDSDQSEIGASAQMFFAPVATDNHVLAESAFLERVSNLKVSYGKPTLYYDGEKLYQGNQLIDFVSTELSVEWFSSPAGLYMSFYQKTFSAETKTNEYDDYDDWGARIGFLPMPGILVYSSYQDETGYKPNFTVKYVSDSKSGKAVNLEANYIDYGEDGRNYLAVAADIYLSRTFSFGGTISQQDDTIFGVRTRYFFGPRYNIGASAHTGAGVNEFIVSAGIRF